MVYHIFVPSGAESWTWVATVPAPLSYEQAARLVTVLRPETPAGLLRIVPVEDSPHPHAPRPMSDDAAGGT